MPNSVGDRIRASTSMETSPAACPLQLATVAHLIPWSALRCSPSPGTAALPPAASSPADVGFLVKRSSPDSLRTRVWRAPPPRREVPTPFPPLLCLAAPIHRLTHVEPHRS